MENKFKVYHLSIRGKNVDMFNEPLYLNKSKRIKFNGIIDEHEIKTEQGEDYISLAPKFKPHSDYEMMLQSTDNVVKSPSTSLTDEAIHYIFGTGYKFIKFLSDPEVIEKYGMEGGYPYLVFNYDEYTTDRHSGMSKKPFHLHLNSWKKETIDRITEIKKSEVSPYYYESVVDPIFDLTRTLAYDALDCEELNQYLEKANPICGDQEIFYSGIYKVKGGWEFLNSEEFPHVLKTIHERLETRYKEILKCFTGNDTIPALYTRHPLLNEYKILNNIAESNFQDTTKEALVKLIPRVRTITDEEFQELCQNTDLRDTIIPMRWVAYSVGFFSNDYIEKDKPYEGNICYMNCTPRLFTKIGGASIMNFPERSLVKIDRGEGTFTQEEFNNHVEFQKEFVKKVGMRRD
ncbi:MAG: hypothetical protein IJ193_09685 [Bacilli bacterium]|nr:hypothetical protein [Bacilli bacterium]